jgi:amino acid transporter
MVGRIIMEEHLRADALTHWDTIGSTLANIGPAFSIYVTIGAMAQLAGNASLYTIVLAGVVSVLLSALLGSYARRLPVAGSYVQYVAECLGYRFSIWTALMIFAGTVFEFGAVSSAMGRFVEASLNQAGIAIHWPYPIVSLIIVALAVVLVLRGVRLASRWILGALGFEVATLMAFVVWGVIHIQGQGGVRWRLFNPLLIPHPLAGIAASFPVVFFLFMGWDNSASLAEETIQARTGVRKSAVLGTIISGVVYLLASWVVLTIEPAVLTAKQSFPFASITQRLMPPLTVFVYISSVTSTFGVLLAMLNARARILFGSGRAGILPSRLSRLSSSRVPFTSVIALTTLGTVILIGGYLARAPQIVGLLAGVGTFYFMVVYALTAFAFPFFLRQRRETIRVWRHIALPYLVGAVLLIPMYATLVPNHTPSTGTVLIVLISLAAFAVYALTRRSVATASEPSPAQQEHG